MTAPLAGVRVVEMANVISGPFTGMLLADLGADVVKVELTGKGDVFRQWAGDQDTLSPPFAAFNRRKRSVTVDVHDEAGARAYLALTAGADVVLENFRPGVLDRMGVGYDAVRAANPEVIYCAISGVGQTGPESARPTYDAIAQAKSGLTSQLTALDAPEPVGPPLSDQITGMYAAYGILGALYRRQAGGGGEFVDVSMLSSAMSFQTIAVTSNLMTGEVADKIARAKRSQTYAITGSDGRPFAIHLSTPHKFWVGVTDVIGRPELREDDRFRTKPDRIRHYAELRAVFEEAFAGRPRAEWLTALNDADVPAGPINTIEEALADEQTSHLDLVQTFGDGDRAVDLIESAVSYTNSDVAERLPPPQIGEHTDELLLAAGVTSDELADLRERGIV
ncbi:MAG: CoA transferase [Nitriliruptoraceae bacterium]|nr:CoA transferase [Nitriliruptoraceae bacterium]